MRQKWVGKQINLIEVICRRGYANEWNEGAHQIKKEKDDDEWWGIKMLRSKECEKKEGAHDNWISTLIIKIRDMRIPK